MGNVVLKSVVKQFGDVVAVNGVNIDIKDGEIVSFLGPSGCGKTTTLRMIAGLDRPTDGEIYLDDRLVSSKDEFIPPEARNLGMVFQNYAIWPHMTVFHNVAYPLKLRKVSKQKIREKVTHTLELVGMNGFEKRYPSQLSGGQQQRVALARALVMEPTAMLLDEPLSNLDAKLREHMRFEIMEVHKKTNITLIYVTHDQSEAMVLSDKIVVMDQGSIQQIADAVSVYHEPTNKFVADFIGLANFINCKLTKKENHEGEVVLLGTSTERVLKCSLPHSQDDSPGEQGVVFVRPENIRLVPPEEGSLVGRISRKAFLGNVIEYWVEIDGQEWRVESNPELNYDLDTEVGLQIKEAVFLRD